MRAVSTSPLSPSAVALLIATRDREPLLLGRALPSVIQQSVPPDVVVVVSDGAALSSNAQTAVRALGAPGGVVLEETTGGQGAGAAWNVGLRVLHERGFRGYVALLDDDDAWDPVHLQRNLAAARAERADVVVSGLRMLRNGREIRRPLPRSLTVKDFLVGNPGWQGSNTFVRMARLQAVGGFREDLPSLNDRDLAIRLLRDPQVRVAYTGQWTANWYADTLGALSAPASTAKRTGLARFWRYYGGDMSPSEQAQFFARAQRFFEISRDEVLALAWPRDLENPKEDAETK